MSSLWGLRDPRSESGAGLKSMEKSGRKSCLALTGVRRVEISDNSWPRTRFSKSTSSWTRSHLGAELKDVTQLLISFKHLQFLNNDNGALKSRRKIRNCFFLAHNVRSKLVLPQVAKMGILFSPNNSQRLEIHLLERHYFLRISVG